MRKDCSTCKHDYIETEYPLREPCNTCIASSRGGAPNHWEASEYYRPDTNADRIRAMTDEELGRFLAEVENRRSAAGGGAIWKGAAHAIEWLRQPVKED